MKYTSVSGVFFYRRTPLKDILRPYIWDFVLGGKRPTGVTEMSANKQD